MYLPVGKPFDFLLKKCNTQNVSGKKGILQANICRILLFL